MIWWLLALLILSGFLYVVFFGAPYVPTWQVDIDHALKQAKLKRGQVFVDLGCGDGKVLVAAAKRGAKVVGYEINPILWLISWWRVRPYHGRVYLKSFWRAELTDADVVFAFLATRFMAKFERVMGAKLRSGTTLISYVFELPHKPAVAKNRNTYFYKF